MEEVAAILIIVSCVSIPRIILIEFIGCSNVLTLRERISELLSRQLVLEHDRLFHLRI